MLSVVEAELSVQKAEHSTHGKASQRVLRLASTLSTVTLRTLIHARHQPRRLDLLRTTIAHTKGACTVPRARDLVLAATEVLQQRLDRLRQLPPDQRHPTLQEMIQMRDQKAASQGLQSLGQKTECGLQTSCPNSTLQPVHEKAEKMGAV
jgi:hypothetical protein